ncbi:fumarylacetoacetate hydrolase family protein [Comamonas badia]|uniref:fumarylacetoacetate hydrolase family protein n=1 Tax=Comamonas badia TaxID=265291 RepID=UPI000423C3E1|nr:fumarylacetoacetate hydrolase family protein [Comamonas badia]
MKLATLRDGSRDGQLVVVSRDLAQAHYASGIAARLQQALEDWNFFAPQLQDLYDALNAGRARHAFALDPAQCLAPLPRCYHWAHGSVYPAHAQRCPQGAPAFQLSPADHLLAPQACWQVGGVQALDFAAGLAVVTGDVPRAAGPEQAAEGVRLLLLALTLGQPGSPHSLATAFAPVALTPDELGEAWRGARARCTLQVQLNGRKFGLCETGPEMALDFGASIAQCVRWRGVAAGSIVGALPVSNADAARGFCSLAERRGAEVAQDGEAKTAWLRAGDALQAQARLAAGGQSLFGAIDLELR